MKVPPGPEPLRPQEPRLGALLALGLAGFCAFLNVYAAQPLLPLLTATFGASKAAAGLTVSAPNLAVALAAPLVSARAARYPLHRVIAAALLALSVPTLLAATADSLPALIGWRFVQGLAVPGVYAVGMAYAASTWPPATLGRATAALVTGNVLGGFFGRTIAGFSAEAGGWRSAFVVLGLLTAAGAAATWWLLPAPDGATSTPYRGRSARPWTCSRRAGSSPPSRSGLVSSSPRWQPSPSSPSTWPGRASGSAPGPSGRYSWSTWWAQR